MILGGLGPTDGSCSLQNYQGLTACGIFYSSCYTDLKLFARQHCNCSFLLYVQVLVKNFDPTPFCKVFPWWLVTDKCFSGATVTIANNFVTINYYYIWVIGDFLIDLKSASCRRSFWTTWFRINQNVFQASFSSRENQPKTMSYTTWPTNLVSWQNACRPFATSVIYHVIASCIDISVIASLDRLMKELNISETFPWAMIP